MSATRFLVTTGPESSGKTTLARDLSSRLSAPLVAEASRDYLNEFYRRNPGRSYGQPDLLRIARLQFDLERKALAGGGPVVSCDTDLLVLIVWSEVKYRRCDPEILELFRRSLRQGPRLYLLCDPELPWEADPLRENPADRDQLLLRYLEKLDSFSLPYLQVRGSETDRVEQALDFLEGRRD